ncbi:pyridoxal phosphate-dependent decarboxylase family protein [Occallatibacter riparius]|uniref:Aminotransferase class V-fold PLP-dependent enzyme n=1 Tax=Occallatibacter riparius TaxID=1002689 RepID=A0A9J7BM18_9BACT|nr:aminotransferase class V-fold PLP-dependent enzyme [Occallatibacter riparius]UWZ83707.1 aminotransferase class V-fold PLP-dependent enzyme [Occallatibacter riparius]
MYPSVSAEEIRSYLTSRYDFKRPMQLEEVAADAERMLRQWQVQVTHPRYFGLYNPSVTLSSVVADTLVATYNPQLASWRTSPAANEIERHTLAWFAGLFGLPADSAATFTSGGAEANLSAVVSALASAFPRYSDEGLHRLPERPAIYLSSEAHHSFDKIACMTGLGRSALRVVPVDSDLKMDPQQLVAKIANDRERGFVPLMVVGTAGTTAAGVIDPLPVLADICREKRMWFHVDAAWGGAAIVSPSLRRHLAGIESADSITCDAHKWLSVAMACGMFFCRHPEVVRKAFSTDAGYMPSSANPTTSDPYMTSVQWSRRFIGLKLFLSLAERGENGQATMIEHQARMGDLLRQSLTAAGWRVVNRTPLPVICFTRDGLDVPAFLQELKRQQIAWMSETSIAGTPVVRACITSFKTTADDIFDVVREITDLADEIDAQLETAPYEMN